MICPKYYNTCTNLVYIRGTMLIDILIALSLGAFFVALMSRSAAMSGDMFASARARLDLMYAPVTSTSSRMYGNERVEYNIQTNPSSSTRQDDTLHIFSVLPHSSLVQVEARPDPLCSVDFGHTSIMGSGIVAPTSMKIDTVSLPIPPGQPLTHVEVRNGMAYISTDSSKVSDPDLYTIDIHDSMAPRIMSSLNTGPGIASFALVGTHIFAAAASTAAQLHILRISSAQTISLDSMYRLPLPYATATPPFASAITYHNGRIYLGTEKWDGAELSSIDVFDVNHPQVRGSFEIGNKINDIISSSGFDNGSDLLYVSAAGEGQLRIFNMSDRDRFLLKHIFSPSGWNRQEGKTTSLFEDQLIFGRTSGGYDISTDHELFLWATTSSSSLAYPQSTNMPGGIYGIIQHRLNTYAISHQSGRELIVSSSTFSLPMSPQSLTCDGSTLYVLSKDTPTLYVITFS